ncbi:MAG: HAMP domain-containing sensor histidine kinase [Bacteroidetes bacterium]|nr:HAMP domain-containing sensor histidine kinase [Bacteroidota bacterium]
METIANTIIYFCDASSDPLQIQRLVTTLQLEPEIGRIITIAGNPPTVFASSRIQWIDKNLSTIKDLPEMPFLFAAATSSRMYHFEKRTAGSIIYITSLKLTKIVSSGMLAENGAVFVELNVQSSRKELSLSLLFMTFGLLLSTSLVALIIFLIINRFILQPADVIINTMEARANGNTKIRVPVFSSDEIGTISISLNEMLDELELESSRRSQTEQQIRESEAKLRELNSTKNTFFSIIAHDLKSPFNSILGFSRLLQDEYDSFSPDEQLRFIRRINDGINNVYKLLENLLEWSKVQLGRNEFSPEAFDIGLMIFEMVHADKLSFEKKAQKVRIEIPDNTIVHADQNMTRTILRNLVSNAVKFSGDNKTILIKTVTPSTSDKEQRNFIGIAVIDEGIGIQKENLDLLFRIDSGFHRKGTAMESGTGLGLILCKEFVEKQGGIIWAESEEGKGSSFTFTVPSAS